ncbi:MAG: SprT family zinc-dependent metalloprotease [Flavobacterium sp.]|uniref:M48 family metallopeptidase n=1 Tax=Flavobacterium sp. TaxID=239 RepID=UPI00261170B8|nr:SprT family zinc-dependent metalloprotease [Flavobacterium sp.]MDD5150635.1 SprT family zinc-dependent metalloprotease [Flavobacterium sp.]
MLHSIQQVNYGSKSIEYNLSFAARKSLGIKVLPDGLVKVIAPNDTSIIDINKKVKSKANWILKQQAFFCTYKPNTPERKYLNGETHLYLGRQYKLQIIEDAVNEIKLYRGAMIMKTKKTSPEYLEKKLNEWYKEKAIFHFEELLDSSLEKFNKYKIEKPVLEIRLMQKRWGSCTKSGKIILNTELIKAPKGSIEYVVIHELCHLIHHNHNKKFYDLQNALSPNWDKWKEKLEHALS